MRDSFIVYRTLDGVSESLVKEKLVEYLPSAVSIIPGVLFIQGDTHLAKIFGAIKEMSASTELRGMVTTFKVGLVESFTDMSVCLDGAFLESGSK